MNREFTQEEIEQVVREVEESYEQIFQDDLAKHFFRFRVQSHYCAYLNLKSHRLDLFDANGKITRAKLMGVDIARHLHTYEKDEFGAIYFMPVDSEELLDGEAVIERLLYYYFGKSKIERYKLMKELLADYRKRFREGDAVNSDVVPSQAGHL
jgi:hypothetical protein